LKQGDAAFQISIVGIVFYVVNVIVCKDFGSNTFAAVFEVFKILFRLPSSLQMTSLSNISSS